MITLVYAIISICAIWAIQSGQFSDTTAVYLQVALLAAAPLFFWLEYRRKGFNSHTKNLIPVYLILASLFVYALAQ